MNTHIREIRKLIPSSFCNKIINYYANFEDAKITDSQNPVSKKIRNCKLTSILENSNTVGQKLVKNFIMYSLFKAFDSYKNIFPDCQITKFSQIDLLQYESNNYKVGYDYHVDMATSATKRILSFSICLNNDFLGGDFEIKTENQINLYQQNVGDCLIFPSNFMFPHKVHPITKGTRYALIAWGY